MKFSVVIPLYNKAAYVVKAIQSVLAQTFTDFELIIVDDGSKDNSAELALKAIAGRENCCLLCQENAGVSVARNNGVANSQGDYLCFLDADDWWESTFLEEMSKLIEEFSEAGIYGTNYTVVSEHNHKTRVALVGVEEGFEKGYINYCKAYAKTMYMPLWTGAVCIPQSVYAEMQGFKPQLKMGEDFDLWVRIALKYNVAFLNKPLAFYNQDVETANRAIGTLPSPKTQFAFCAGYLRHDMKLDSDLKYVVEHVQIVCLRSYYLSRQYHLQAKEVIENDIDLDRHFGQPYADYLRQPVWITNLIDLLKRIAVKWI